MSDDGITFHNHRAGDVDLHVAQAGPEDGPLVILLHGFPEFWFGWRDQIGPLAEAGYRVMAPDQRGYDLSGKPAGVDAYRLDKLADDIFGLADAVGRQRFSVVGHDWGAAVAWWMATRRPERLERLVCLNAPHPGIWLREMTEDPVQRRKSAYVRMLRLPWLPEVLLRGDNYARLAAAFASSTRPEAFGPEVMARYRQAWARLGALTGMINWYRALFRQAPKAPGAASIPTPTLVIWGDRDAFAESRLAEASAELCADAQVLHLPDGSHWVVHDQPQEVRDALLAFLRP